MDIISDGQVTVVISLLINAFVFRSRVSDPSLKAILDFYKYTVISLVDLSNSIVFQKEMIRIVEDVSSIVYSDIERVLEDRERGLLGISLSHTTLYSLKQMRVGLNRAVNLINSRSHA